MGSCLTGFELKVWAEGVDKWRRVESGQKYGSGLGLCVRAGEAESGVQARADVSSRRERSHDHRENGIIF